MSSLSRLMTNINGPRQGKQKLLMATTHSILLYGSEIWGDALKTKKYYKAMTMTQRQGALRIASAYRAVSAQAALVVAGVIPIDLLTSERKRIYERSANTTRQDAAETERTKTLQTWQERWTKDTTASWTRRLIPKLKPWTERNFGDVNFYITQFLTGHGYFRRYLRKMDKVRTETCKYCDYEQDDVEHTFFDCNHWADLKRELEMEVGSLTPDDIINAMLRSEETWKQIATHIEKILRWKRLDGCLE